MTVDDEHARRRADLGAYLLGSLAPAERDAVDAHLARCGRCRAELAALAPLPGLLGRLAADEARDGLPAPSDDLLRRTLAAARYARGRERRRLRGWRIATGAAAAAVVVAAAALLVPNLADAPETGSFAAVAGVSAAGSGNLEARTWGTALELQLSGLPQATAYEALAHARDGRTEVAATWGATASGRATVAGATAIARADLETVEVRTSDGRSLMNLPC